MPKFWKIVVVTKRLGRDDRLVPMKEFYLVAIGETPQEALQALHARKDLGDAELRVLDEAPPSVAEYFDVRPGEIFCVMAVT
jgi:hypothetical protein